MKPRAARAGAILIVVAAAALRFWALDQGLPHTWTRPDEREALQYTAAFPTGDLNPRWFIYPPLYFYLLWGWEELLLALRRLWVETPGYAAMLRTGMPTLLLYGRALSALVGTATVAVLYAIGSRIGGAPLGLVAALLLAVDFLHVRDSHSLKPDVALGLGMLVSLWSLARYGERPDARRGAVAGLALGLTTGLKYNALILILPAWLANARASARAGVRRLVPSAGLLVMAAVAAVVFLVPCWYVVADFARARDQASALAASIYATRPEAVPPPGAGPLETLLTFLRTRALVYHATVSLRWGAGLAMLLAAPLAVAAAFRRPRRPMLVLSAVFVLCYFLAAGLSPVHLARYVTPLIPPLVLLVAHLVVDAGRRAGRAAPLLTTLLVALLAGEPLARSLAYDRLIARTDTRVLATGWMAERLPPGAVVGVLGSGPFPMVEPAMPPRMRAVRKALEPGACARGQVTHLVTVSHPELTFFTSVPPARLAAFAPELRREIELGPFEAGPAGWFEAEDAYYVPFHDFAGVVRPGPVVAVYACRGAS